MSMLASIVRWSELNPELYEFRRKMNEVNRMLHHYELPKHLQVLMRTYFFNNLAVVEFNQRSRLLTELSPSLQAKVAWELNQKWLENIWFLMDAPMGLLFEVAMQLQPILLTPGEFAQKQHIYVASRGIGMYGFHIITPGKSWGEEEFLICLCAPSYTHGYTARAVTHLEAFYISPDTIRKTMRAFPHFEQKTRYRSVRRYMRYLVGAEARRRKREALSNTRFVRRATSNIFEEKISEPSTFTKRRGSACEQAAAAMALNRQMSELNMARSNSRNSFSRDDSPAQSPVHNRVQPCALAKAASETVISGLSSATDAIVSTTEALAASALDGVAATASAPSSATSSAADSAIKTVNDIE